MNRRARSLAFSIGRVAIEVAPVVAALSRASSPFALIAAGAFAAHKIHGEWMASRPRAWESLSWSVHIAVLEYARALGIGDVVARYDGGEERKLPGVLYGAGPHWVVGPYGDPRPLVESIWTRSGGAIEVTKDSMSESKMTVLTDVRSTTKPSRAVKEIARDCLALNSRGFGIGILLDGPPGSGKSQALRYVARCIGGRSVRASLKTVTPDDVVAVATTLGSSAVILDDIDRGPTDIALGAVEMLVDSGCAVLASSNQRGEICDALLRDGRIDDHRSLGAIEPDVLHRMTDGIEPEIVEVMRRCTVASVSRYLERRAAWGPERARAMLRPLPD